MMTTTSPDANNNAIQEAERTSLSPKLFTYTGQRRSDIPSDVTVLAVDFTVERIEEAAFANQDHLRTAFIPSTVQRIEGAAFANCRLLEDLELAVNGGSLESIGSMAFARCPSLAEVSIPSSVEEIGDNAFMNCTGLVQLIFQKDGKLKKICEHAFRRCEALATVSIPSSVHKVEEFAFDGCQSLVELNLSVGLQYIGRNAFSMCVSLRTVDIPSTVLALSEGCFANCKALVQVHMSTNGLEEIPDNTFEGCCSLQTVSIPETVFWIGDRAFTFCIELVSVELPKTIDFGLGEGVFHMCKNLVNLANLAIPNDSIDVPDDAFVGCTVLKQVYTGGQLVKALGNRFDGFPIHQLCYHASTTTVEDLLAAVQTDTPSESDPLVDAFGMTPFHVLASGKERVDLFRALLGVYPRDLLTRKDRLGNSALGYLCTHVSQEGHDLFQTMVLETILDPASQLGLREWRMKILDLATPLQATHEEWQTISYPNRRKFVEKVYTLLAKFMVLEKVSLLEAALWKAKIQQSEGGGNDVDRPDCRIMCGASIVIPQVMAFLGY